MPENTERKDVRIKNSDDGPVLEVGETKVLLRTFLEVENDEKPLGREHVELESEVDFDGDNGSWWNLTPTEDEERRPWVTIQPELIE